MTFPRQLRRISIGLGAIVALIALLRPTFDPGLAAQCNPNPIVCENAQTGSPSTEWDITGSGDATLQGFATDISANKGDTVRFKVTTTASRFNIDIYRLGYYNGMGARKIASIAQVVGQNQPARMIKERIAPIVTPHGVKMAITIVPPPNTASKSGSIVSFLNS